MRIDVNLENADETINNMSDDTLMTVCVDDSTLSNLTNDPAVLSHLSICPNTPDTLSMQEYQLKTLSLFLLYLGPLTHAEIKTHHPVSVSLIDPIVHPR